MAREGAWPRVEPVLASYVDPDVMEYLETLLEALAALARLFERSPGGLDTTIHAASLVWKDWIEELPAQLATQTDWERASVAYVQLLEGLEDFVGPFEEFLRTAAELGTIPDVDVEFGKWVLKCIRLCLTKSEIAALRGPGCSSWVELCDGVRRSMVVAAVLRRGFVDRLTKDVLSQRQTHLGSSM